MKLAPSLLVLIGKRCRSLKSSSLKRITCFLYFSAAAWTVGLGTNMREEGAQQKNQAVFAGSLVRRSVLDCFQMNNLTVIDLHVLRSAVHLINVVADLKKKRDISQLFTNRQVNFTTERYRNRTVVRHFNCGVSPRGIFNETEVG